MGARDWRVVVAMEGWMVELAVGWSIRESFEGSQECLSIYAGVGMVLA
jgi:hypothetical protein